MKEGFKTIQEIIKEVGEEEGFSYNEMEDIWIHQRNYIKKMQEKEGVYAIFLPFIGTLSLNVKQAKKELKGKSKEFYKNFLKKVEDLQLHPNYTQYHNSHKKVTGVNRLARNIIRRFETFIEKERKLIPHKDCWEIIEKYSNNIFTKK